VISGKTWLFLISSGFMTGASWLCYFKALQLGDVNKVTPIDKSSTIITMLFAFLLLGERLTILKLAAVILIGSGTFLMIQKKKLSQNQVAGNRKWIIYAMLSALFASLTSILGKIGIEGVEVNLGTAIRTCIVLIMAWLIVFMTGKHRMIRSIDMKSWTYLVLSGISTGASWLCYYRALKEGPASVVVPIDKLSILVTIIFSWVFLKERLAKKAFAGLILIVSGTLALLLK
jgi:transporter family protein